MDLKDIKELIDKVNSSDLAYFELKMEEDYIKMDKSLTREIGEASIKESSKCKQETTINSSQEINVVDNNATVKIEDKAEDENLVFIKAPMVGTFYGAAAPGKPNFVSVGQKVSKGDILCIVEAMKLMNEIECEFDCEIVEILVKDSEMVEYGQPIFKVRRI